ncbi:MAG: DUF4384 domain-containing protein [Gemmatimonadaceae bacterium]
MSSFANVLALVAGLASGVTAPDSAGRASLITPSWFIGNTRLGYEAPDVELWVSGDNLFRRGDRARVYFRTDEDAYVTIVRIDTDGRLDILFPEDPYDDNEVRGGHTYRVYGHGHESFVINDYPGLGYIFAIASWDPFDYDRVARGRTWDYHYAGGRVHRDPYIAARDFADLLLDPRATYSFDVAEYHVERRVSYPRFLCYDCHAYRPYPVWNPYSHACVKFRIVVWDDPYYYPYRRYGGRRVVYVRERVREPRYEFKELPRGTRPTQVTQIEHRRRPSATDQRRPGSPLEDGTIGTRRRPGGTATGSAGATRPGDDVREQMPVSGRRRATELDQDRGPTAQSPIRGPRRDPPTPESDDDGGSSRGRIREPRRDAPSVSPERAPDDDRVIIEDRGRREPRDVEPRAQPRRDQSRGESPRDEPRRESPRPEPRREPRSEPRNEPQPAPRREPSREQPRAEPRSPPKAAPESAPSRQSAPRETRKTTPSNGGGRRT